MAATGRKINLSTWLRLQGIEPDQPEPHGRLRYRFSRGRRKYSEGQSFYADFPDNVPQTPSHIIPNLPWGPDGSGPPDPPDPPDPPVERPVLLLEDGTALLQEDGNPIFLEEDP